ncbi:MAG TPA: hypothetical protein ENJ35_10350 [Gammaproteobacteria bacterium]|nr:hypothetical protein [Gammaproteobacteria bacterium]
MPELSRTFRARATEAIKLARVGEIARAESRRGSETQRGLHHARLELLYELAFLRVFLAWETFLEASFLRYLCGYSSSVGGAVVLPGRRFYSTITQAEHAVVGRRRFVLWHDPDRVVDRSNQFLQSSPVATVVQSYAGQLKRIAAIRHRIVHVQKDARQNFDEATMAIAGRRYRGGRAGAFLRDRDASAYPPARWLETLTDELQNLAVQIA